MDVFQKSNTVDWTSYDLNAKCRTIRPKVRKRLKRLAHKKSRKNLKKCLTE